MRRLVALLLAVAACGNGTASPPVGSPTEQLRGPSPSPAVSASTPPGSVIAPSPTPTPFASVSASVSASAPTSAPTSEPASPSVAATRIAGFEFRDDDEVQVRHILISPNHDPTAAPSLAPTDAAWEAARQEAEALYTELTADPARFAAVAASTSDDVATRDTGGLLPYYARASLNPVLGDAIFATNLVPGQVLAPIRSTFGWHIIQFVDRRHAPRGDFTCQSQVQPVVPADPVNGQVVQDMGRSHVQIGTNVPYAVCPPASGPHYSSAGKGPIAPRFYGPDDVVEPQSWVHNLEHGGLVVLYRCGSSCVQSSIAPLRGLLTGLPKSPRCGLDPGQLSPVVARFDQMAAPYAALLWDRVLFLQEPDLDAIAAFYTTWAEQENPEHLC